MWKNRPRCDQNLSHDRQTQEETACGPGRRQFLEFLKSVKITLLTQQAKLRQSTRDREPERKTTMDFQT